MRTSIIILILLTSIGLQAQKFSKKAIEKHCNTFATHILTGEFEQSLDYFDPDYLMVQHNEMLGGNTKQFLMEFLAGYAESEEYEKSLVISKLSLISDIKLKSINKISKTEAEVKFDITVMGEFNYVQTSRLLIKPKKQFFFTGPLG